VSLRDQRGSGGVTSFSTQNVMISRMPDEAPSSDETSRGTDLRSGTFSAQLAGDVFWMSE
jgi:hypothetical protein